MDGWSSEDKLIEKVHIYLNLYNVPLPLRSNKYAGQNRSALFVFVKLSEGGAIGVCAPWWRPPVAGVVRRHICEQLRQQWCELLI